MKPEEIVPRLLDNPSAPVHVVGAGIGDRKEGIEHPENHQEVFQS